jgi:hypothetical protein
MTLDKRVIAYAFAAAFAVVVLMLWIKPGGDDGSSTAVEDAVDPIARSSSPDITAAKGSKKANGGAGGGADPQQSSAAGSAPDEAACAVCREKECTNYEHQGVDLLSGCFKKVDGSLGADTADLQFLADCQAVVQCAHETNCAANVEGAAACYCGSRSIDDCIDKGPGPDAPCVEQWLRAGRTRDNKEIAARFSDLKYPSGWANFMIECDRTQCKGKCLRGS